MYYLVLRPGTGHNTSVMLMAFLNEQMKGAQNAHKDTDNFL
jgi:hypothetical protein